MKGIEIYHLNRMELKTKDTLVLSREGIHDRNSSMYTHVHTHTDSLTHSCTQTHRYRVLSDSRDFLTESTIHSIHCGRAEC